MSICAYVRACVSESKCVFVFAHVLETTHVSEQMGTLSVAGLPVMYRCMSGRNVGCGGGWIPALVPDVSPCGLWAQDCRREERGETLRCPNIFMLFIPALEPDSSWPCLQTQQHEACMGTPHKALTPHGPPVLHIPGNPWPSVLLGVILALWCLPSPPCS